MNIKSVRRAISVSSSGSIVAIASSNGVRIKCYDTSSSRLLFTLLDNTKADDINERSRITKLVFCNNDTHVVGQIQDLSSLMVWDVIRGVVSRRISVPEGMELRDVTLAQKQNAVSKEEKEKSKHLFFALVRSASDKKLLVLEYDVSTGKIVRKIKVGSFTNSEREFIQPSLSGKFCAIGDISNKTVKILNTKTGKRSKISLSSETSKDTLSSLPLIAFTSDEKCVLHCKDNTGEVMIHSVEKKDEVTNLKHNVKNDVVSMEFGGKGCIIMTHLNGSSSLIALNNDVWTESIKQTTFSAENGSIRFATFHPSTPNADILFIVMDNNDSIRCVTQSYRAKEQSATSENSFLLGEECVVDRKEEEKRPEKKRKLSEDAGQRHDDDDKYDDNEMTIGERLAEQERAEASLSHDDDDVATEDGPVGASARTTPDAGGRPALSTVLRQALTSNDDSTLENVVFSTKSASNQDLIRASVSRLSDRELNVLTCKLAHRATSQPVRLGSNHVLTNWLQCVLVQLVRRANDDDHNYDDGRTDADRKSEEAGTKALQILRNVIAERIANLEGLMDLEARLELMGGEL